MIDAGEANAGYRSVWIRIFDDSRSTRAAASDRFAGETRDHVESADLCLEPRAGQPGLLERQTRH